MAGDCLAIWPPRESLENVRLHFCRDCRTAIADNKINGAIFFAGGDMNAAAGPVVLPRVLEQVLQDEGSISPLTGDEESFRQVRFHIEPERIRQRIQIVEPFFDELAQVDRAELDLQAAGVHPREQEQIVDYPGETVGLVMKRGKFVVNSRFEMFPAQQFFNSSAQNRDGSF